MKFLTYVSECVCECVFVSCLCMSMYVGFVYERYVCVGSECVCEPLYMVTR